MTQTPKNRFISGFIAGILVMAVAIKLSESLIEIIHLPSPSSTINQTIPLSPVSVDSTWIKSGSPNFRASMFASSPDKKRVSGIWVCDGPSTFEWHFSLDESVYIIEGEVTVTYMGKKFILKPGDTATFQAGTAAVWEVPGYLKKSFTLHAPEKLVRVYRKILANLTTNFSA